VNLNVGADPEDMVSIRVWVDAGRVISLRNRRLMAVQDLRDAIEKGDVPATPGALLIDIAAYMIDRMGPVLADLNDAVDELEEEVLEAPGRELRTKLSKIRRQAISLRRFLAPLREVLTRLYTDRTPLFDDMRRSHLREIADRLTRYIEELDSARDRAAITQEELAGRMADEMNKNMYVLSIVAGIFLPLGLLTGLMGINVGGMPGTQSNWGFAIVCIILVGLAVIVLWLFRRFRIL
jgi:zinc transporter